MLNNLKVNDTIQVSVFGTIQTFRFAGEGAYPYDCTTKTKYPTAKIFYNDDKGSWISEMDINETSYGLVFGIGAG